MEEARIESDGQGRFRISGPMVFGTATKLLQASRVAFGQPAGVAGTLELDLSGVSNSDSAGLALLLEWASWARDSDGIRLHHIPEKLCAIARLSEIDRLFTPEEAPDLHRTDGA